MVKNKRLFSWAMCLLFVFSGLLLQDVSANTKKSISLYGIISDVEKALNVSSVYNSLNKGNIVVLRGASEEGRHAWILDEYLITQPGYDFGDYNVKIDYVRANMGWGGDKSDGFYEISEQGVIEFNTISGGNFVSGITCFTNVRRK